MPENTNPVGGQGFPPDNRDGTPALVGKDDYTKWEANQRANASGQTVLVGNFADLQRLGAEAATGGSINVQAAVAAPPGVNVKDSDVVTPAQHDAVRGEVTRETIRTGLLPEPPAPVPAENTSPNPVDPGSQSPTVETKGGSATKTAPK